MMKTVLVLPDGREISSGGPATCAILSCDYTQSVNAGEDLTLGSVCAAMAQLRLWAPGGLTIAPGDRFTLYKENETRKKLGVFIVQSVESPSRNTVKITGYDPVILLEKDVSSYLASRSWPASLQDLAAGVCAHCGVTFKTASFPNAGLPAAAYTPQAVTGRQVLGWIAQAAGRFCRADSEGRLEFSWYEQLPGHLIDGADLGGEDVRHLCSQGSLQLAGYTTAPVGGVWIRAEEGDTGVRYPEGGDNPYCITGNPFLTGDAAALTALAQGLYAQLQGLVYTPGSFTVSQDPALQPGHIVTVRDQGGNTHRVYLMERRCTGTRDTFRCAGNPRRDSPAATVQSSTQALRGKVLRLQADVDGIRAENKAADGRLTSLELDVDGIRTQAEGASETMGALRRDISRIDQDARQVRISLDTIQTQGAAQVKTTASYTFNDQGLRIEKSGDLMGNRLDNTGMYVTRAGQALLTANADGVAAADVQVKNYLVVGQSARLEDYPQNRTACFYIGG